MPHWIMVDLLDSIFARFPSLTLRAFDCADFAGDGLQLPPRKTHNMVNDCVDVVNQAVTLSVQLKHYESHHGPSSILVARRRRRRWVADSAFRSYRFRVSGE
jgi:hypothetical protein